MNQVVYRGLAVSAHPGPAVPAEARFSNIAVTGEAEPDTKVRGSEEMGVRLIALPAM